MSSEFSAGFGEESFFSSFSLFFEALELFALSLLFTEVLLLDLALWVGGAEPSLVFSLLEAWAFPAWAPALLPLTLSSEADRVALGSLESLLAGPEDFEPLADGEMSRSLDDDERAEAGALRSLSELLESSLSELGEDSFPVFPDSTRLRSDSCGVFAPPPPRGESFLPLSSCEKQSKEYFKKI